MQNLPDKHYNPRGYEAAYDETCGWIATVRGFSAPDGKIVERGGPTNPDDKPIARFHLDPISKVLPLPSGIDGQPSPVRETFHDALHDYRDLVGAPIFRNKPESDVERRLFSAAYDAAQKIRANATVLGVNKFVFMLNPSLFAFADCFSRDASGAFWLMFSTVAQPGSAVQALGPRAQAALGLSAYILEAGEYVPSNAAVRLGLWTFTQTGPHFVEIPNDRIAARDAVITYLQSTPF